MQTRSIRSWLTIGAAFLAGSLVLPTAQRLWLGTPGVEDAGYPINAMIQQVRDELLAAEGSFNDKGEDPMFQVKHLDLELAFTVKRTNSASADGKFQLVAVSSDTQTATENVQRIKLHLEAAGGREIRVITADADPVAPIPADAIQQAPPRRKPKP